MRAAGPIEYRSEDCPFPVSASCVTISNSDSFSSILKQGLICLGQEAEKSTCLNELDIRKQLVVSISQRSEELRLYNLV